MVSFLSFGSFKYTCQCAVHLILSSVVCKPTLHLNLLHMVHVFYMWMVILCVIFVCLFICFLNCFFLRSQGALFIVLALCYHPMPVLSCTLLSPHTYPPLCFILLSWIAHSAQNNHLFFFYLLVTHTHITTSIALHHSGKLKEKVKWK